MTECQIVLNGVTRVHLFLNLQLLLQCVTSDSYLQFGRLLQGLLLLPFSVFASNLKFLNLGLGLFATVFQVCFALIQSLHLSVQLVELALQGLLGFLHGHLVLQECHIRYSPVV